MVITYTATDGVVTLTIEQAVQLYTFCEYANVDLHTFTVYTVNVVIGALSVGTVQDVTSTWNTGTLNKG